MLSYYVIGMINNIRFRAFKYSQLNHITVMRYTLIGILMALFISTGTVNVYADRHDKESPRHEQRFGKDKKKDKDKPHRKKDKKHNGKNNSYNKPGSPSPTHIAPPPSSSHRPGTPTPPPPPPERLPYMVRHATKGCSDVNVWQIDHDTYIVKYRKGRKYYTREIYPYREKYGKATLINVNWQPHSPWVLIPPMQININL